MEDRDPAHRQAQRLRGTEEDLRSYFQCFDVDVRLIEPVEEYQPVRTGSIEPLCHVSECAEERTQLHRDRDRHCVLYGVQDLEVSIFDIDTGEQRIGREVVNVELDCVGASILDLLREVDPSANRNPVQASNDGNL